MSYDGAILYLYNLQKHGIKLGLDNITRLLAALNNPHRSFRCVHVGGTNGKGSTSAVIASILRAAGLKVGLFTSPHLVSFTERIRIDGEEIREEDVVGLADYVRAIVSGMEGFSPTFFEVVTAMALLYFERKEIDIAVMEVGMGGRLDATNVVLPEVSVVTNIGYDHREFLGETLTEIAREKAGIIKSGVPVVSSRQETEAAEVIHETAKQKRSELYIYGEDFGATLRGADVAGIRFDYGEGSFILPDLFLPLAGGHQMQNASVAIRAAGIALENAIARQVRSNSAPGATGAFIREGLSRTRWPGRLEFIHEDPPIVIDGAHNPAAAAALARTLKDIFGGEYERIIMVLGVMSDKDIKGILKPLLPVAAEVILTSPSYSRAASPARLAEVAASLGAEGIRATPSLREAIAFAIRSATCAGVTGLAGPERHGDSAPASRSLIVITGSFYTIGEAKEILGSKGVFPRLRE